MKSLILIMMLQLTFQSVAYATSCDAIENPEVKFTWDKCGTVERSLLNEFMEGFNNSKIEDVCVGIVVNGGIAYRAMSIKHSNKDDECLYESGKKFFINDIECDGTISRFSPVWKVDKKYGTTSLKTCFNLSDSSISKIEGYTLSNDEHIKVEFK